MRNARTSDYRYAEELVIDDLSNGSQRIVRFIVIDDYSNLIALFYHSVAGRGEYMPLPPYARKNISSRKILPYLSKSLPCEWAIVPRAPGEHHELRIGKVLEIPEDTGLENAGDPRCSLLLRIHDMAYAENRGIESAASEIAYSPYGCYCLLNLRELRSNNAAGNEIGLIAVCYGDDCISILASSFTQHIEISCGSAYRKTVKLRNRCRTSLCRCIKEDNLLLLLDKMTSKTQSSSASTENYNFHRNPPRRSASP